VKMDLKEVLNRARENLKGVCRVCRDCDGVVCAGEVPGMGGIGTGTGFKNNVLALRKYQLNMRTVHSVVEPDLSCEVFGVKLEFPVLAAPVAGAKLNFSNAGGLTEPDLAWAMVGGAYQAGTLGMIGHAPDPFVYKSGLEALERVDGHGVAIIKPMPDQDIKEAIQEAEEAGALAVGIDIDSAGLINMRRAGYPAEPKSVDSLRELVNSTSLPFVLKGLMTPDDAALAVQAGVSAIVISNHGGRCLDHTPGTADVLPSIAAEVKGKITILFDGGVRSGFDVLKALALGADAVMIGRPLSIAAFGGGAEGVRLQLEQYKDELEAAMILTGCPSIESIGRRVLWEG